MKKPIKESIKPTFSKPISDQSKGYEKQFTKSMATHAPTINLNEVDVMLSEVEQSLKKKIFSLAKMESLVFADPKLTAIYNEMAENGEEKYGYHYNETIQNMIFNDYVLNSPKYLQKYKMAVPKKKKRRDKSGINQLKKSGEATIKKMNPTFKPKKPELSEDGEPITKVLFLINERDPEDPDLFAYFPENIHNGEYRDSYSQMGQHSACHPDYAAESREATPEEYQDLKAELENEVGYNLEVLNGMNETTSAGSAGGAAGYVGYAGPAAWGAGELTKGGKSNIMRKPIWKGGRIIQESNYLIESSGFEKYVQELNEQDESNFNDITKQQTNMITTKEQLKQMKAAGQKLTKDMFPSLSGQALYAVAIQLADRMLTPMSWDELPDTNSMWNYIDENGGMLMNDLVEAVKEACNDRLSEDGMSLDDLMGENKSIGGESSEKQVFNKGDRVFDKLHNSYGTVLDNYGDPVNGDGGDIRLDSDGNVPIFQHDDNWNVIGYNLTKVDNNIKEETQTMIQGNNTSISNKARATGEQGGGIPMGMQATGGMNEELNSANQLLEELNNELDAYSIHHDKLKKMAEDRKPSALVLRDRVGSENETNFKKDLQHSGTKEIIDVEKELMYKDQQTDIGKDPQKLGQDIEKKALSVADAKSGEALKNVGDSANDKGDEIPKRNLTTAEQDEIDLYRKGMHSWVYDNEPGKRFEDRMKADMGEKIMTMRDKQLADIGKQPMYNKDTQPVDDGINKVQFDKEKSGWNERKGIEESMITGRYHDILNKRRLIDFTLDEVRGTTADKLDESYSVLDFTGLGNSYVSKTIDNKVIVNEGMSRILETYKFYTDGKNVVAVKNPVQNLNENELKGGKSVVNEQADKMKHLLNYKPNSFVNTANVKKNRGF